MYLYDASDYILLGRISDTNYNYNLQFLHAWPQHAPKYFAS